MNTLKKILFLFLLILGFIIALPAFLALTLLAFCIGVITIGVLIVDAIVGGLWILTLILLAWIGEKISLLWK